jgi:hypothetical protein
MSRFPVRDVTFRTPGPSVNAPGDGLEGAYSAVVHEAPSGGTCKVTIPALSLMQYYTAVCSPAFTVNVGDIVLVIFDQDKQPWLVSPTSTIDATLNVPSVFPAVPASGLKFASGTFETTGDVPLTPAAGGGSPVSVDLPIPADWVCVLSVAANIWPEGTWTGVYGPVTLAGDPRPDYLTPLQATVGIWNSDTVQSFIINYTLTGY